MDVYSIIVEVSFPEGVKNVEMKLRSACDMEECEVGRVIYVELKNGEDIIGIFKGVDDDDDEFKIGSLDGKHLLGYKVRWVSFYFEEVKN